MISVINGSSCDIPFSCLDVNGVPFTPVSLSYNVQDTTNKIQVVAPTPISPVQTGTVALDSTANTMNAQSQLIEQRLLILKIEAPPGGTFQNLEVEYLLIWSPGTP